MRENSPSQVDGDSQIEETEPTDGGPGGEIVSEERVVIRRAPDGGIDIPVSLRWGDVDLNNHVNNVVIARIFEESRIRALATWFRNDSGLRRPVTVVARQDIEFRAPLMYSFAPVRVVVSVGRIGGKSVTIGCRLYSADGELCAIARTVLVGIERSTGASLPLSDEVKAIFGNWRGPMPDLQSI
ncbi:thioesterase family protein [Gordonia sp. (in: high G+C Gram-positive bacteria)]|uniref:acyl-CoA thioesterase n=1 Tax=Gordonia sp. (in: high G+C Gram-positive bacteria) TaxID=84139 RepID=UPI00261BD4A4|nr:acyl-CoA thioesterase [Gordonia sp. (in: high G+C Gram-positive bacteria)]HMS77374.1 acyl-CoA thioesterase [Gordonia sp. (in: high G+C Gram-positive bacteria)]